MKEAYKEVLSWIADRLKEPSTYRGLSWVLTAFGVAVDPEHMTAIFALGASIAGLIGVFAKENKK